MKTVTKYQVHYGRFWQTNTFRNKENAIKFAENYDNVVIEEIVETRKVIFCSEKVGK